MNRAMTSYRVTMPAEDAALVALLRSLPRGARWGTVSELVLEHGSAVEIWAEPDADALLARPERAEVLAAAARDLESWAASGWRFLGILDEDYPSRVREAHQAPPFLFAVGSLIQDDRAIAVVGSRKAGSASLEIANTLARELVRDGVTVLSGLAAGVDAAAHRAALDAGGRTVAVIGTGIFRSYPAVNRDLQRQIARDGLLLSQFWPDSPPQRHNFIRRNAVMSGYGRATVVTQAGEHGGARAQARMALEHGRPVILTEQVVSGTEWGARMCDRAGVHVGSGVDELLRHIHTALAVESEVDALLSGLAGSVP
jgi:DNA processing protein